MKKMRADSLAELVRMAGQLGIGLLGSGARSRAKARRGGGRRALSVRASDAGRWHQGRAPKWTCRESPGAGMLTPMNELWQKPPEFADVGSARIAWRSHGRGEPLLLIHGWPLSSFSFRRVLPRLAERFTCILPDTPGLGERSGTRATTSVSPPRRRVCGGSPTRWGCAATRCSPSTPGARSRVSSR